MENSLGLIIREGRIKKGISQTELATRICKSPQLLCDIEAGRKKPSLNTLVLLAKELNISMDDIFFDN